MVSKKKKKKKKKKKNQVSTAHRNSTVTNLPGGLFVLICIIMYQNISSRINNCVNLWIKQIVTPAT